MHSLKQNKTKNPQPNWVQNCNPKATSLLQYSLLLILLVHQGSTGKDMFILLLKITLKGAAPYAKKQNYQGGKKIH